MVKELSIKNILEVAIPFDDIGVNFGQKVDFIIATDGYNLSGLPENYFGYSLGYGAANKLNNTPIDTSTQDYKEFLENHERKKISLISAGTEYYLFIR